MTYASRIVVVCVTLAVGACGGATAGGKGAAVPDPYAPEPSAPPAATPPATDPVSPPVAATPGDAKKPNDPVRERGAQLREAADLLDKASAARDRDARSFAEQLFSSAELIVGPEALADLVPLFREGAPPRVTTPTKKFAKDATPQPEVEGDSEKDRPEPKPKKGTLSGTITVE